MKKLPSVLYWSFDVFIYLKSLFVLNSLWCPWAFCSVFDGRGLLRYLMRKWSFRFLYKFITGNKKSTDFYVTFPLANTWSVCHFWVFWWCIWCLSHTGCHLHIMWFIALLLVFILFPSVIPLVKTWALYQKEWRKWPLSVSKS